MKKLKTHILNNWIFYLPLALLLVLLFQNPFSGKNNISNLGPFPDSTLYLNTAKNISQGQGIKVNYREFSIDSTVPPLYPLTIAPFYAAFKDPRAFYLTNILFVLISTIFLYKILLKLFQNKLLIFILLLTFVTNYVVFYYPSVAMPETLLMCLYIVSIYVLIGPTNIRSSIVLALLTISFIATKYNAWPISSSLLVSYIFLLVYKRKHLNPLKHFFYFAIFLSLSALLLIILETTSKTGNFSDQIKYYLRYFETFSNFFFPLPQSLSQAVNTPQPATFSTSYISNHLFRYFSGLIGGLSSAAGKDLATIPAIVGMVSLVTIWINIFIPKFRLLSIYLLTSFITTLIFISTFFIYDGRYTFTLIPIQILAFGISLDFLLSQLKTKKLIASCWIILATCLLGIIINNFQPLMDHLVSNSKPDNSMGAYSSVIFYNQNFKERGSENKPKIISTIPPLFAEFYSNQNYDLIPLSNFQYFFGKPEIWVTIKKGEDLYDTYETMLKQGTELYVSNYLTTSLYYSTTMQIYEDKFNLIPVSSGCNNHCRLYRLTLK